MPFDRNWFQLQFTYNYVQFTLISLTSMLP